MISALTDRRLKTADQYTSEVLPVAATTADSASAVADRIASELRLKIEEKQALLEIVDPAVRLEKLLAHLTASN